MKKILLCVSVLLLASTIGCGSKHKLIQDEKKEIKENSDSIQVKSEIKISVKDSLNEENEWVWQPQDPCSDEPVEITTPNGTKIKIPKKGVLRHQKRSNHTNTLEKKESSATIKKTTNSKTYTRNRDKEVVRTPFRIPFLIWFLIVAAILIWLEWRRR